MSLDGIPAEAIRAALAMVYLRTATPLVYTVYIAKKWYGFNSAGRRLVRYEEGYTVVIRAVYHEAIQKSAL